jgi:carboxyl-terminal processing protease
MKKAILTFLLLSDLLAKAQSGQKVDPAMEKLATFFYQLEANYVDTINKDKLVEDAIVKVLEDLDPHSVYIPSEELKEMNEPLVGNFEGIGVQFNIIKDTIYVVQTIVGGPSEKLGILAGDKIITIDGQNVGGIGIKNADVLKKLRGSKGTIVKTGIKRKGLKDLIEFEIKRDKIPIYSIDASYMAEPTVGYIKLTRFSATTMDEFKKDLEELKQNGMKDLILDLQGNGGGYLNTAISLADEFLSDKKLIVYTQGRAYPKNETFATSAGGFEKGRLVILIDDGSASASEIVSGAIQDWDRGLIVGRRSFGKGLVQRPVPLPDGSQVRLTIQKYYTPSGRCIQKPYDEGVEEYYKEKGERYLNGELLTADSINFPDSLKFFTDRKRVVYGGGGIMPDVFVSIDTSFSTDYHTNLIRKGILNDYAFEIVDSERKNLLEKYPTVKDFIIGFNFSADQTNKLIEMAEKEEIKYNDEQYKKSREMIESRLKALIAKDLWTVSAYYQVFNPLWPTYKKALELIKEGDFKKYNLAKID